MKWHSFTAFHPNQDLLPPEGLPVLVQIAADDRRGMPASVAVGYLKASSDGPVFIVPGFGRSFVVTHWSDCLPGDFTAPLWKLPARPYRGIF